MQLVDRVIGGWSSIVDRRSSSLVARRATLSGMSASHLTALPPQEQIIRRTVAPANVKLERPRYLLRRWLDNDRYNIHMFRLCVVSSECAHVEVRGCTRGSINGGKLAVLGDALSPTSCFVSCFVS